MIERAMSMLDRFAKHHEHRHEDELVLQTLAATLFNSAASAMALTMRGSYQGPVALMRDMLETTFLLDFMWTFPDQIAADERVTRPSA